MIWGCFSLSDDKPISLLKDIEMPEFKIHIRREHHAGILTTEGYIDAEGGKEILKTGDQLLKEGIHDLVLNLEKSPLINSEAIMCFFELIDKTDELSGGVFFCGMTRVIVKTFRIMGFSEISSLFDTEEEALQAIESKEIA